MSWLKGWRKRLRAVVRRDVVDRELNEELAFHMEMETAKHVAAGVPVQEARRRAALSLGGVEKYGVMTRDARALAWVSGLSLDFRLGLRMLKRYPGLTVVGGLAMAFAICLGAGTFEFMRQVFDPTLPLPEGDRIVGIRLWDVSEGEAEPRMLYDLALWREQLKSVEELGAVTVSDQNLVTSTGVGPPVSTAQISASAFRVARVRPLLGRTLLDDDEQPASPQVVVIGYDIWQSRFGGSRDAIGATVGVGAARATVVGVMPEGFEFPLSQSMWLPLRVDASAQAPREGPGVFAFGRLTDGASLEHARAELTQLGTSVAAARPATHGQLRPQLLPYAQQLAAGTVRESGLDFSTVRLLLTTSFNLLFVLVLILVCSNVALLMFARAAAREGEMLVRAALGASRRRIVLQLFAEALVLGALAAVVGLAAARYALRVSFRIFELLGEDLPFWFTPTLSPATVMYACGLTLLGAAIAGVTPGLKVTRGLGTRLREVTAGGGGFRFGGVWTAIIVVQIAVTVPLPLVVLVTHAEGAAVAHADPGIADEEYLTVTLVPNRTDRTAGVPVDPTAFGSLVRELEQRLEAEPSVRGVTFADRLPRTYHPWRMIEVDAGMAAPLDPRWPGYRVSNAHVADDYFDVLGVEILAGRRFHSGDADSDAHPVIVNQSFVKRVLGGGSAIGRRVRYAFAREGGALQDPENEPWYEIVGVVPDLGMSYDEADPKIAGIYHAVAPEALGSARLAVHVAGRPADFAPRMRAIAAATDPSLSLRGLMPLDRIADGDVRFYRLWVWISLLTTAIVLLLSLAGIYAVMSFTVSQRTREIGIRAALGGTPRRVLTAVFRRPMRQLALGIGAGAAVLGFTLLMSAPGFVTPKTVAALILYLTIMTAVCMLAWIVPTRRALRVQPMEALRIDG